MVQFNAILDIRHFKLFRISSASSLSLNASKQWRADRNRSIQYPWVCLSHCLSFPFIVSFNPSFLDTFTLSYAPPFPLFFLFFTLLLIRRVNLLMMYPHVSQPAIHPAIHPVNQSLSHSLRQSLTQPATLCVCLSVRIKRMSVSISIAHFRVLAIQLFFAVTVSPLDANINIHG